MFPVEHMTSRAKVTPPAGAGPFGPVPGRAVTVKCWPEESVKQVRAADGRDVVSSTRLWTEVRNRKSCVVGASVEYGGRVTEIVAVTVHSPGAIPLPSLLEVTLL